MNRVELLLMRHGRAEDYAEGGDALRPLTNDGSDTIAAVAGALQRMDLAPTAVVHSPLLRAAQTAEIVAKGCSVPDRRPPEPLLTPSAPPDATARRLCELGATLPEHGRLLAVGHNPLLTSLLGLLVFGRIGLHFDVAPGCIAHLSMTATEATPRAVLRALWPADALARLR